MVIAVTAYQSRDSSCSLPGRRILSSKTGPSSSAKEEEQSEKNLFLMAPGVGPQW